MSNTYDVVVVGVGGMGAAALDHLARRGLSVVGVEQHGLAHSFGASHGHSRVIRKAYYEDPRYVPLLQRAYALWESLEQDCGDRLLTRIGCLNIGTPDHPHMRGVLASVQQHHLEHELMSAADITRRFPMFAPDEHDVGVFEPEGGVLFPEACTRAHVARAQRHGAKVLLRERVVDIAVGGGGAVVTTESGSRLAARFLVVSAGPWWATLPFGRRVGRVLTVTRQVQCWFAARPTEPMPVFIQFLDDGRAFYGMPPIGGRGVKACRHGGGARTTADTVDRSTSPADADDVRAYLQRHLPSVDGPPEDLVPCLYSLTPDQHFLVGRLPEHPHVIALGGFSGHGFKMASVMGEIAAQLVVEGTTPFDIGMFALDRFA